MTTIMTPGITTTIIINVDLTGGVETIERDLDRTSIGSAGSARFVPEASPARMSTAHQFFERYMPKLKPLSERPRLGKSVGPLHLHEVMFDLCRVLESHRSVSSMFKAQQITWMPNNRSICGF